jgi:hypothetical protein
MERSFPKSAVLGNPLFCVFQGLGGQAALARAAGFLLRDKAGILQNLDVLHDRGQGHAVRFSEFGNGSLAEHQAGKDGAAGGIGECAEGRIEGMCIVNHVV